MYVLQIFHHRVVDPVTGQQMLETLDYYRKANPVAIGPVRLAVHGVSKDQDPFPDWLRNVLQSAGFQFDDLNFVWQVSGDQQRVYQLRDWFESQIRPWLVQIGWGPYAGQLTSRIMTPSGDMAPGALDSF